MKKIAPPTLMLICLLSMIALDLLFPLKLMSNWILLIFGVGLIIFGLVMAFGAEGQFRKNYTTVNHLGVASKLVSTVWFKYSRNPMYLSFALMLLGAWLSLGSVSPLLGLVAYFLLTQRWYIVPEEEKLAVTFGNEYQAYRKRTRRWL